MRLVLKQNGLPHSPVYNDIEEGQEECDEFEGSIFQNIIRLYCLVRASKTEASDLRWPA